MSSGSRGPPVRRLADWDAARLVALADEHGTPLYVMDLDRVRENWRRFTDAFPAAHVHYAAKAHAGRAVFETILDEGGTIECAAGGEVERALDAGAPADEIQYTAVNPPAKDLDYAVEVWEDHPGFTITAGATDTLDRLAERGFDGRLCIRVNPGIGAGHHEKVATGKDAKFGVPYDRVPDVVERGRERFDLVGIHVHAGSGILGDDLENHRAVSRKMGDLARRVAPLEFVDIGGGFGVPYREDEPPLDLDAAADATREALGEIDARLMLEPGRYIVADAGVLLTRVNTIKEAPETTVVGVDASLTTLIRPAMYDAYHALRNLTSPDRPVEEVTVGGPICESSDVFCQDRPLPRPGRGDVLALGNTGAYGYEMASMFHSQPRPAEVGLEDGRSRVLRRRESIEDVTRPEVT